MASRGSADVQFGQLRRIVAENDTNIDEGQSYLVIPCSEFQEWFQDNVFIASATVVAWHLNEIRWGIYEYLTCEFNKAYTPKELINGFTDVACRI